MQAVIDRETENKFIEMLYSAAEMHSHDIALFEFSILFCKHHSSVAGETVGLLLAWILVKNILGDTSPPLEKLGKEFHPPPPLPLSGRAINVGAGLADRIAFATPTTRHSLATSVGRARARKNEICSAELADAAQAEHRAAKISADRPHSYATHTLRDANERIEREKRFDTTKREAVKDLKPPQRMVLRVQMT